MATIPIWLQIIAAIVGIVSILVAVAAPGVVYSKLLELVEGVESLRGDHEQMRELVGNLDNRLEELDTNQTKMRMCLEEQRDRTEENQRRIHDMLVEQYKDQNGDQYVGPSSALNCERSDCPICERSR